MTFLNDSNVNELRLSVRLTGLLAQQVESRISAENGIYESQSEYIRDLIRRDIEADFTGERILNGLNDLKNGRFSSMSVMDILEE